MIGGQRESHASDASVYLINDEKKSALIDTGTGRANDSILSNMRECGADPSSIAYIFITHCHFDHIGGLADMKRATGAKIVAHEKDAAFIESADPEVTGALWYKGKLEAVPIDIKVAEDEREFLLDSIKVNMYFTPGHSPGSCVYTVESQGRLVLFGQDIHGPINDILMSDRDAYCRSLERIADLEADILCEGHFGVFYGKENVRDFIESYL